MKYIKKYNQKFLESNQINVVPSETKWEYVKGNLKAYVPTKK